MAEEIQETVETQEVTQEEVVETRLAEDQKNVEEKKGIVESIREKFFPKKEVKEETPEPSSKFLEAAKKANFTDEQVAQLAKEYTPQQLEELIPHLMDEEEEEEVEEKKETVEKGQLPDNFKEELKPYIEEMRKFFESKYQESVSELEEIKNRLVDQDADKAMQEAYSQATEADNFFDGAAKDFPVFGNTEELMRYPAGSKKEGQVIPMGPAFEARNSVWQMAMKFNDLGTPWKESLNEAFAWYKGKHGEKELKNRLVKELKKNETRLSPKRTSKETAKTYETDHEAKLAILEQARRKAGI